MKCDGPTNQLMDGRTDKGDAESRSLQRKTSVSFFSFLAVAAHYNSLDVAQILIENGAATEVPANNMFTSLHIAAKKNHLELAKILLDRGANVDASSVNGTTPLHLACESRHAGMAELLLEKGATPDQKSQNGKVIFLLSLH